MNEIRTYKANLSLPKVKNLFKQYDNYSFGWHQEVLPYGENEEFFCKIIPIKFRSFPVVTCHTILGGGWVISHVDGLSRSVFVVPVKVGKRTIFQVGDRKVNLKVGWAYRFNDHNVHEIINDDQYGCLKILTMDFMRGVL